MRRKQVNPISLFSFQDIITGLCGIMIFLVLIQLVGIVLGGSSPSLEPREVVEVQDDRDLLRKEIAVLERQLVSVRAASAKAIMTVADKIKLEDAEKAKKELSEKELIVAALVSQVHDLETQVEKAKKTDAENRDKIKEMERTRRLLEQQITRLKGRRGVTLMPEKGDYKIPIYVVCSASGLDIHRPFEKHGMRHFSVEEVAGEFGRFLEVLDHTTHSFVLLVRPSGVKMMNATVDLLVQNGFTYGRDPLEEDMEVAFSVQEAK